MINIDQLLDTVKAKHGIKSDYKLAFFLGVTEGGVANWRHKRSLPDEQSCEKIAAALGMDPDVLIAQIQASRSKSDASKAIWQRLAERLRTAPSAMAGYSTPLFMVLIFAITFIASGAVFARASAQSSSDQSELNISSVTKYTLYFFRLVQRWLSVLTGRADPSAPAAAMLAA